MQRNRKQLPTNRMAESRVHTVDRSRRMRSQREAALRAMMKTEDGEKCRRDARRRMIEIERLILCGRIGVEPEQWVHAAHRREDQQCQDAAGAVCIFSVQERHGR